MSCFAQCLVLLGFGAWITGCCASRDPLATESITQAEPAPAHEEGALREDLVAFVIDPVAYLSPGTEQLALLSVAQPVSRDSTILIPYVGPLNVVGLTDRQITALVSSRVAAACGGEVDLLARRVGGR